MRVKIYWASLIVGRKFSGLLCISGQFPSTRPRGGLYLEGPFNGGFLALRVWGAYNWRALFSEFYGIVAIIFAIGWLSLAESVIVLTRK